MLLVEYEGLLNYFVYLILYTYKDLNFYSLTIFLKEIQTVLFVPALQMKRQGLPPFKFKQHFRDCFLFAGKEQSCSVFIFKAGI